MMDLEHKNCSSSSRAQRERWQRQRELTAAARNTKITAAAAELLSSSSLQKNAESESKYEIGLSTAEQEVPTYTLSTQQYIV